MLREVPGSARYPTAPLVLFGMSERVCSCAGCELQRTPLLRLSIIARLRSSLRNYQAAFLAACKPPLFGEDIL